MSSDTLSDDALREIEAAITSGDSQVMYMAASVDNVRALCATVRALREKHTQLAEVSGEWAKLLDRIRLWSKCEDGYPLDEHINNITTKLAQVTQERDDARKLHTDAEEDLASARLRISELKGEQK